MEINKKMSLQHCLYEYEVMTAQQLALLHSYQVSAIYAKISLLNKQGLVGKVDVPTIGRGSRAYHLNAKAARYVAEDRNELSLFREKDWSTAPSGVLSALLTNQFCCELIRATKDISESGLTDWRGSKKLFQPFVVAGETKLPPKMNGSAVFHFDGKVRYMYVNVLTGNESITVINEMLNLHLQMIQEELGEKASQALFLFMYLGNQGRMVLQLWKQMLDKKGANNRLPFLAVANFEDLAQEGVFSKVWSCVDENENIGLLDMPSLQTKSKPNKDFLGKKQVIKLNFNQGALTEIKEEKKILIDEIDDVDSLSSGSEGFVDKEYESKQDKTDDLSQNGIDWNIS